MTTVENSKWYICRICLKGQHKKLYNIFEGITEDEITDLGILKDKIELCGGIKLYKQNNLPSQICNRCVLLLRAAYKFRDLCQQSQNQLEQFIDIQKQEIEEHNVINFDSDAEEQQAEAQEEVEGVLLDAHTGYMIEERVDDFDAIVDIENEENNKDEEEYDPTTQQEDDQFEGFSDDEDLQYVVEEVNAKQFVCEDEEEEQTTYRYEEDTHNDNIIIEEQTGKPEARKIYITKKNDGKTSTKRKRKSSEDALVSYECSYCDNKYAEKAKYTMHIKMHNKDKQHECEICNKRFSTTPQLSRHMNSHTGNRPYKCNYCAARFGDPSTKIKHERIHTNERPYKCNTCDKAFAYSNVLKVHMMTHTGEKPHTCEYCGKSFTQLHHKNTHEKRHTSLNMVPVRNSPDIERTDEESDYKLEEVAE